MGEVNYPKFENTNVSNNGYSGFNQTPKVQSKDPLNDLFG